MLSYSKEKITEGKDMKKNIKKSIKKITSAVLFVLIAVSSVNAYANFDSNTEKSGSVAIDSEVVEDASIIIDNGRVLVPIRSVAQALGYEVEWNGDARMVALAKMPSYITFTIGIDGYTFARTAPMPLGTAPEIIDGSTYVPVEVISELMGLKTSLGSDNVLRITSAESEIIENEEEFENNETLLAEGEVISVEDDKILFNDPVRGEVILAVGDAFKLKDNDGNIIDISEFGEGDLISVEYSEVMTMSIPPVNNPVEIVLLK